MIGNVIVTMVFHKFKRQVSRGSNKTMPNIVRLRRTECMWITEICGELPTWWFFFDGGRKQKYSQQSWQIHTTDSGDTQVRSYNF